MINRLRIEIIFMMTEIAVGPEAPEQSHSSACMARFAFQGGVGSHERKPVPGPGYIPLYFLPTADTVTFFAVASHLAAMNIGMTIAALRPDLGKNKFDMTMPAIDFRMHFFQRETGGAVTKIGI